MNRISDYNVIILAAGEGKRLRPFTNEIPKSMVKIDGMSLIERQIKVIKKVGLEKIIIVGGYKSNLLKKYGDVLIINDDYNISNMVHTLFCAEKYIKNNVIISYGDIVYSENILKKLMRCKDSISTTIDLDWENYWRLRHENILDDAETLILDECGFINELGKKPKSIEEIQGQYMGLIKLNKIGSEIFVQNYLSKNRKEYQNAYMTAFLQDIIDNNNKVKAVPISGEWVEIDTIDDLKSSYNVQRIKNIFTSK